MAFLSKTNVMIKFLQKQAVIWAKNANIFAKFFGENILKIITSVPDWANCRPMDDCLLWAGVFKISEVVHTFGYFFPTHKILR
jgi:hypothetical protein